MNNGIGPALFARVLKLSDTARVELLETLGEQPIREDDLKDMLDRLELEGRLSSAREERSMA